MALLHYAPATTPSFEVLYQDDDLIVLNKAPGLLSVPGKALEHKDSLQLRVQRVFPTASVVHRLDMATSGIIVMALNKAAHVSISRQFELRQTSKTYFARVYGIPTATQGEINLALICDWPNRPKQKIDIEKGKSAITHWQLVSHNGTSSLIKLTPITGRSHQLRVHMLAIGHPILGDRLYAHEHARSLSNRLCLHAQELSFMHPSTEQIMRFEVAHTFDS